MKSKALIFLFAFSFLVQIIIAQKTGFLFHTITIKLPQFAGLSLSSNSNSNTLIKKVNSKIIAYKYSNLWLNYHCVLKGTKMEPSKNIQVQLTEGKLDKNFTLWITTSKDSGKGKGKPGKAIQKSIVLNNYIAKKIIDDIEISNTGKGVNEGHKLTYLINSKNSGLKRLKDISDKPLSITYTLFDN